jgi:hypothetical protein
LPLGQDQPPPALCDEVPAGVDGACEEPPDPLPAVNELTAAVTSLPLGATSHHFAPKLLLPCPLAIPAPESPEK